MQQDRQTSYYWNILILTGVLLLVPVVVPQVVGVSLATLVAVLGSAIFTFWLTIVLLLTWFLAIEHTFKEDFKQFFYASDSRSILSSLLECLRDMKRLHVSSFLGIGKQALYERRMSFVLHKVLCEVLAQLPCRAAQIVLYDESSERISTAMMLGSPSSMCQEVPVSHDDMTRGNAEEEPNFYQEQISFAGTNFGSLRIELEDNIELSLTELRIVFNLANKAALLLINARFTEEVYRMKCQGEETQRAKTGFLATLSHEIRGPLGIVLNGTELIADGLCGDVSEMQKETLEMVKKSGEHLLDLVNDVLDYAKAEAGNEIAKPVAINLSAFLKDIANVMRTQATKKNLKLSVIVPDQNLGIICDRRHARQIMINFLTNAIKYTEKPEEQGVIRIIAERLSDSRARLSVSDSGIGIPVDQRDKVFNAFQRIDQDYARDQLGTGLGMALTKKLTELNGGKIGFESVVGEGSTFWILMNVSEVVEETEEVEDESKIARGHGEDIILVDKDNEASRSIRDYLQEMNYKVTFVTSSSEVIRLIKRHRFDLALVENDLDDIKGADLIKAMRCSPNADRIPMILVSSRAFPVDIEHYLRIGVDRFLAKPLSLHDLLRELRSLLEKPNKRV